MCKLPESYLKTSGFGFPTLSWPSSWTYAQVLFGETVPLFIWFDLDLTYAPYPSKQQPLMAWITEVKRKTNMFLIKIWCSSGINVINVFCGHFRQLDITTKFSRLQKQNVSHFRLFFIFCLTFELKNNHFRWKATHLVNNLAVGSLQKSFCRNFRLSEFRQKNVYNIDYRSRFFDSKIKILSDFSPKVKNVKSTVEAWAEYLIDK